MLEKKFLEEQMASEELKEIYDFLGKKLNSKTNDELNYLRKRNAELEKENKEQYEQLYKYKQDANNIRKELEAEYKEKERNLYKRPISEIVGLVNRDYFFIRDKDIYADCPHCNNTRILKFTDPFGKKHSWNCECAKKVIKKEYYAQSRSVGVIDEISLRNNKIHCFVDFREKEYNNEPYISGTYLNPEIIIKTKEDLKKVYDVIDKTNTLNKSNPDLEKELYYSICGFLFADKELINEIVDYLNTRGNK